MRIVIKIGGSVLDSLETAPWLRDVQSLVTEGHNLVLVHGAGSLITEALARHHIHTEFVNGQRVTTPDVIADVIREMRGIASMTVVSLCRQIGISGVGLSGADGGIFDAVMADESLGLVGRVATVRPQLVETLWSLNMLPVITPVAPDIQTGKLLNLNGDWAASGLAQKFAASALLFYTDTGGVRWDRNDPASLMREITVKQAQELMAQGRIAAGMIPKVQAAIEALAYGVEKVGIGRWFEPAMTTWVVRGE
ncbi:MAG: acetylglutamate kinase [Firmicutes bacterium]|jgi:acetylglutamate kinase|nr:acetylglutamate kinase [Bacillota bacterium]